MSPLHQLLALVPLLRSYAAQLAPLDWLLLAFALWSVVRGLLHGAIREIFAIAGTVAALLVADWQYRPVAIWLTSEGLANGLATNLCAFLLVAFAVLGTVILFGRAVREAAHLVGLGLLDRLAGGLLGLARAALVATLLLTALSAFLPPQPWLERSRLTPPLAHMARALAPLAPMDLQRRVTAGIRDLLTTWRSGR